jgi:hypothetical protein
MVAVNPAKALFKDREAFQSFHTGEEQSFVVVAILYAIALAALCLVWAGARMPILAAIPAYIVAFIVIGGPNIHSAMDSTRRCITICGTRKAIDWPRY